MEAQVAILDERLLFHGKKISDLEKKKTQIKETPELTIDEFNEVKSLQDVFEAQHNSFKGLTWAWNIELYLEFCCFFFIYCL